MMRREQNAMVQLKVRMREALRALLEQEAQRQGTSINAEVVSRLEQAFQNKSALDEILNMLYGPEIAAFITVIGRVALTIDNFSPNLARSENEHDDRGWLNNPAQFDRIADAIILFLKMIRPTESQRSQTADEKELDKFGPLGRKILIENLAFLARATPAIASLRADAALYEQLGPARARIQALLVDRDAFDALINDPIPDREREK